MTEKLMTSLIALIYTAFIILCTYFSMWAIADYLLGNVLLALLFLPFALRLGINLHIPKRFWAVTYLAEYIVLALLAYVSPDEHYLVRSVFLSFLFLKNIIKATKRENWRYKAC